MQIEKRALDLLNIMKNGEKPGQGETSLQSFGEALHFLDSNNLATGITVNRSDEGDIVGCTIEDECSVTESGYEFLEKNAGRTE
ncbi:hypothetical protein RRU94_18115 [Domibacillus sp. DTU_2020_1001157_1_SI_ALB_TIR_016]|uniref:hypothetical protein n=1 Tax=Domibacillus sp. DTU_2020_1001157_1_SI_ALB_TIR_016 TaxID=3077789 RepID=UPI0028ECEE97|nr:hypothetical protein [Domibacillus sp. DTU_2020_1001157_1_SI_ALB_TIR_016]WNS79446.1 hypothetical protein RRU94_18115 [Domibacillus sp. DTU_2020_1001157_1_SI_ALB_TIR_016]